MDSKRNVNTILKKSKKDVTAFQNSNVKRKRKQKFNDAMEKKSGNS
jgi:hypothetical protein